jgi:hypothetical protein
MSRRVSEIGEIGESETHTARGKDTSASLLEHRVHAGGGGGGGLGGWKGERETLRECVCVSYTEHNIQACRTCINFAREIVSAEIGGGTTAALSQLTTRSEASAVARAFHPDTDWLQIPHCMPIGRLSRWQTGQVHFCGAMCTH